MCPNRWRRRWCDLARPGRAVDVDDVEAAVAVGVPDVAPSLVESGLTHGVCAPRRTAGRGRLRLGPVEVGDLLRMQRIANVEHAKAGHDERARHDARIDLRGNTAVVSGVALK